LKNSYKVGLGLIIVLVPSITIFFSFESSKNYEITIDKETEIVFAIIGDYGANTLPEKQVSELVHSWNPQFIITTGDNNYHSGEDIDDDIGQFYSDFIGNYQGVYGKGSEKNRFYPVLGNHDKKEGVNGLSKSYFDYFPALREYSGSPGNKKHYDFEEGSIHFFALDSLRPYSDWKNTIQAHWLKEQLEDSTSTFNIVYFHHPPFTNTKLGSTEMNWPFEEWGADIVVSGHAHTYERFDKNGFPYVVNGLGGHDEIHCLAGEDQKRCSLTPPQTKDPDTVIAYNSNWGAMLVNSTNNFLNFTFIDINYTKIDSFIVDAKKS